MQQLINENPDKFAVAMAESAKDTAEKATEKNKLAYALRDLSIKLHETSVKLI